MLCRILEYFAGYDKAKSERRIPYAAAKLLWPRVGICTEDRLYYRMKAPSFRDEGGYPAH